MVASTGDEVVAKIATTADEAAATAVSNRWLGRDGGATAGASDTARRVGVGAACSAARRVFVKWPWR